MSKSTSWNSLLLNLGLRTHGGSRSYLQKKVRDYGIDTSHFQTGRVSVGKQRGGHNKLPWDQVLVVRDCSLKPQSSQRLRRALIESGVPYECLFCGQGLTWNGEPLTIQVDHIDGDRYNNRKDNLRFLCPNCHTQTPTWGRTHGDRTQMVRELGREPSC